MVMVWIGICVFALVLELLTPTALVSIWFAVGALAAWICALFGFNVVIQILVCIVISIVFIVIVRPIAVKYMRGNTVPTNADRSIGDVGMVTKEIREDSWGEVHVGGAQWSAVSIDDDVIMVGTKVRVIAIEGAKLLVRVMENKEDSE